ncbi:MAG: PorV/PorQ family protein [Elusimicrobiales bacterium]|nr:PorV/PorQ family protein [Elusimicrobiales bacterium]
MKKTLFSIFILFSALAVSAQESGVFLTLPLSPRAGGMGDASVALADDPLGLYYNPAGMVFAKRPALSLVYHKYLQDINGNSFAFVYPFRHWAIGVAPTIYAMKEEPIYDSLGADIGEKFGYEAKIMDVALAGRIGGLALGVAGKSYSEDIGGQGSATTAYDVGAIYKLGKLSFGAVMQNLGGKIFEYKVAKIQRLGAAYNGVKYSAAVDLKKEGENKGYLGFGGAYNLSRALKLRGGWQLKDEFGGITFGLGFELGGFNFDYAFLSYGDLGATHKAGISLAFGSNADRTTEVEKASIDVKGPVQASTNTAPGIVKIAGGTNIAVAEFVGKNVSQADASIVTDFLRTELVSSGLFNVMDRNNMDTVLAEQKFQNSGCTEQECAVEMGKLLNIKQVLVGSLSKLLDSYYVTVNVVDVETGKISVSYNSDAVSSKELKEVCRKIVKNLSRK